MSFNVVSEDPTHNGHILKPLVERILREFGQRIAFKIHTTRSAGYPVIHESRPRIIPAVASLVFFTARLPSPLVDELAKAGFEVFEALAISEVLNLCETEKIDMVLISADVDDDRANVIQQYHMAVRLKPETTIDDVMAELWQILPHGSAGIQ